MNDKNKTIETIMGDMMRTIMGRKDKNNHRGNDKRAQL